VFFSWLVCKPYSTAIETALCTVRGLRCGAWGCCGYLQNASLDLDLPQACLIGLVWTCCRHHDFVFRFERMWKSLQVLSGEMRLQDSGVCLARPPVLYRAPHWTCEWEVLCETSRSVHHVEL